MKTILFPCSRLYALTSSCCYQINPRAFLLGEHKNILHYAYLCFPLELILTPIRIRLALFRFYPIDSGTKRYEKLSVTVFPAIHALSPYDMRYPYEPNCIPDLSYTAPLTYPDTTIDITEYVNSISQGRIANEGFYLSLPVGSPCLSIAGPSYFGLEPSISLLYSTPQEDTPSHKDSILLNSVVEIIEM